MVAYVSPQLMKSSCVESKTPPLSEPLYTEVIDINSLNHAENIALPLKTVEISFDPESSLGPQSLNVSKLKAFIFPHKRQEEKNHPLENPLYP